MTKMTRERRVRKEGVAEGARETSWRELLAALESELMARWLPERERNRAEWQNNRLPSY